MDHRLNEPPQSGSPDMAQRAARHDWSASGLGPREAWPQALHTLSDLVLSSRFPMFVIWGPERILIYNDAYAPILGDKHPDALGRPFFEVWPEVRAEIAPVIAAAFAGEPSYFENMPVVLHRDGRDRRTYFTFAYSGVRDGEGRIGGALCVCMETTGQVEEERQRVFFGRLEAQLRLLVNPLEIIEVAQAELGRYLGASRVGYGDVDTEARYFTTDRNWTDGSVLHHNGTHDLAAFGPDVLGALRRGETLVIEDVALDARTQDPGIQAAFAHLETRSVVTVTLVKGGRMQAALYVHDRRPRAWMPEDVKLAEEVAERTWSAVERARAEAALRGSEQLFRTLAQTMPNHVWAADAAGEMIWFNRQVRTYAGLDHDDGGDDLWSRIIHPDDWASVQAAWRRSVDNSMPYEGEVRLRRADGVYRWHLARAMPIVSDGQVDRWVGTNTDIEDQKAAAAALAGYSESLEQEVRDRTRELAQIWNLSRDPFVISDQNGVWLRASPAWTQILGWTTEELVGRTSAWMEHPDDQLATQNEREKLAGGAVTRAFENRFRTRDGAYRWFSWSAVPEGGLIYNVARDVTEEKEAAETLRRTEEALRQAQKMEAVGQLTGGIAHDFNNLLTGIIGGLDIVKRRIEKGRYDDLARFLDAAMSSANRAAGLTHRLLAFSRRQSLDLEPTDVNGLVVAMQDLFMRTIGENIVLRESLEPEAWMAETDANQLETALLNLVINARDAMPEGGELVLSTRNVAVGERSPALEGLDPGEYLVVSVADTGVGMSEAVLQRAFDPFFTTKPLGQGTGLGLSMVFGFVKQSKGYVRIDSAVGRGTRVDLYLPRTMRARRARLDGPSDSPAPRSNRETVLLVEDDPAVRQLVIEVLDELNYAVIEAEDGTSALPIVQSDRAFALLVTDVGLPGINGRQLAEIARSRRPSLPILFITGYAEHAANRRDFLGEGMQLIAKPFALDELARRISAMLDQAGGSGS